MKKLLLLLSLFYNYFQLTKSYYLYNVKYYKRHDQFNHLNSNKIQVNVIISISIKNNEMLLARNENHSEDEIIKENYDFMKSISKQLKSNEDKTKLVQHNIDDIINSQELIQIKIDILIKQIENPKPFQLIRKILIENEIKMLLIDKINLQTSKNILLRTKHSLLRPKKMIQLSEQQNVAFTISYDNTTYPIEWFDIWYILLSLLPLVELYNLT